MICVTGISSSPLLQQAQHTYEAAQAPGTRLNKILQAKLFLAFMLAYNIDPFHPTTMDVILYGQLLKNSGKTPRTIKYYISGAKTFLEERGYDARVFSDYLLSNFMKGVDRESSHIPSQALPIPNNVIKSLCIFLRQMSSEGIIIAAGVLFAYATMLRQCHLFYTPTGHDHLIRREDVWSHNNITYVVVRSSKTTTKANISYIPIYPISDPDVCPVRALATAMSLSPGPPRASLFLDPVTGAAVTASRAMALFRLGLKAVGFIGADSASFHSLRRMGVQVCARAGLPLDTVKVHGLWKSAAIKQYMPAEMRQTSAALAADLSHIR